MKADVFHFNIPYVNEWQFGFDAAAGPDCILRRDVIVSMSEAIGINVTDPPFISNPIRIISFFFQ